MNILEVRNLSVEIKNKRILTDISLNIEKGSWLMVVGPNGAGKSTLAKAIMQMVPYTGSIYFDGKNAEDYKKKELAGKVGILLQNTNPGYDFTAREVIKLGQYSHKRSFWNSLADEKVTDREISDRILDEAIEITGVNEFLDRSVNTLSGGELQRVFLAQLIAQDPDIMILDEPTNHLDLAFQKQIMDIASEWMKSKNKTLISVVHDISLAKMYGTESILMDKGRIAASGDSKEVLNDDMLNSVYGMDVRSWMIEQLSVWK